MWIRTLFFKPKPVAIMYGQIVSREDKTERPISFILKENEFGDRSCIFINNYVHLLTSQQHTLYVKYIAPWLNNAKEIKDFNLSKDILELC